MSWQVISLGGSVIAPQSGGVALPFITEFCQVLARRHIDRQQRFAIVTGGGSVARRYQQAMRDLYPRGYEGGDRSLDMIGIAATRVHAELIGGVMSAMLGGRDTANHTTAHAQTHTTAHVQTHTTARLSRVHVLRQSITRRSELPSDADCLISGGWKPGVSTDYIAVQLALYLDANQVVNVSDVASIYTADPSHDPTATRCATLNWHQYRAIIGAAWHPGAHLPFDPYAARLADEHNLTVRFVAPTAAQLQQGLDGTARDGTVVSNTI